MRQRDMRRALLPDRTSQAAGVDAAHSDAPGRGQPAFEIVGRTPVRRVGRVPFDDHSGRDGLCRFVVVGCGAGVADMRESEGHDLSGIAGVGHDLLIAGHGGVETQLGHGDASRAESATLEDRAVGKGETGGRGLGHGILRIGMDVAGIGQTRRVLGSVRRAVNLWRVTFRKRIYDPGKVCRDARLGLSVRASGNGTGCSDGIAGTTGHAPKRSDA